MMRSKNRWLTKQAMVVALLAVFLIGTGAFLSAKGDKKSKEGDGKGFLGINIENLSLEDKDEFGVKFGVLVTGVSKDEAAFKAGIKKYDVIQYLGGERMRRSVDLIEKVRSHKAGEKLNVKLVREGEKKELTVTLGEAKFLFDRFKFAPDKKEPFYKKYFKKDFKKDFFHEEGGAYLGVQLQELKNEDFAGYFGVKPGKGVLVMEVKEDGPAAKAGFKAGDVIVKMADEAVSSSKEVIEFLSEKKKGDKIEVQVVRHKKKKTLKPTLAEGSHFGFRNIIIKKGLGNKLHFPSPMSRFYLRGVPEVFFMESNRPHYRRHDVHMEKMFKKRNRQREEKIKQMEEKMKRSGKKFQWNRTEMDKKTKKKFNKWLRFDKEKTYI